MNKRAINKAVVLTLASIMTAGNLTTGMYAKEVPQKIMKQDELKGQTTKAMQPKAGYTFLSAVKTVEKQNNIVMITYENGEKARITFLDNTLFRLDMEPDGKDTSFKEYAVPNEKEHSGRIVQQKDDSREYKKPSPTIEDKVSVIRITTLAICLEIDKKTSIMKLIKAQNKEVIWEESSPIQYKKGSTIQTLKEAKDENFYGGGTQNGRFAHKGESIDIVNTNTWTDGGVASPNPFYWSTKGYGVVRNTFQPGNYDFGKSKDDTITTTHKENRFDAYYFVGNNPTQVLDGYYKVTGNPSLFPMNSFYLGHLNCYNRDEWREDADGKLLEDGRKYKEKNNGGIVEPGWTLESLNGKNTDDYKFSARAVLDGHVKNNMPFGWFLPNDGYGCGYGQSDTSLDDNVANLRSFSDYAAQYGVGTGLWTQSALTPDVSQPIHLQRDFEKEVKQGGVRTLKTDVAWVGDGYSFGLNGIFKAYDAIAETKDRPTIITLDGWAGTQRYGGIWTGDQTGGNWEYIRFHIPTYIGQSLSGNPNVSSDVDGIFGGSSLIQTRDIQWKSFTTMMLDMDGWGAYPKKPYIFGEDTTSINRMYLKLRSELLPYIYSTAYTSANLGQGDEKGKPQVRAMFLEYPNDPNTYGKNVQYQFMMGKNLLVAPVYQNTKMKENGDDIRNGIYLPDKDQVWIDYFTGKQYRGNQTLNNFDAPIWKLPLFVKNGAIIPMYAENNNAALKTKENEKGLDKTKRIVEFYPDATKEKTDYTQYEDDGTSVNNTNKEQPVYGSIAKTHFTSRVEHEVATLTAEKTEGSYTGFNPNQSTTFVVNVSDEPSSILAKVGENSLTKKDFKVVHSQDKFDAESGNVYFYNKKPNLNKYAAKGSSFSHKQINTTPKLYVKLAKTNIQNNAIEVQLKGFVNVGDMDKDELNTKISIPTNLKADASKITPTSIPLTWDKVGKATSYQLETDGIIQGGIMDTSYTHTNVKYESTHTYRVRAVNKDGYSKWSEKISATSGLDPYRNVPKNIETTWAYGDDWGALKNATDLDYGTFFHSSDNAIGKDFIMDLKKVYQLDHFAYTPRQDTKGNGTVQQMDMYVSVDGVHYELAHEGAKDEWQYDKDMRVRDTKKIELNGQKARYIKLVARKSIGDFFSAAELQPFIVDGTSGMVEGDTNNDGIVDENDITQIDNYVGLEEGDATWDQVKNSDWNANAYYDAYDIAITTTQLHGGIKNPAGDPLGSVRFITDKTSVKKGDEIKINAIGVNMQNIYAVGFKFPCKSDVIKYKTIQPASATLPMKQYQSSRKRVNTGIYDYNLNVVYTNIGDESLLSGTKELSTFTFIANKDMEITNDLFKNAEISYVGNNRKEINPKIEEEDVNVDAINAMIKNAKEAMKDPQLLTEKSLNVLQEAIVKAEKVAHDKTSQDDIDHAVIELHNAILKIEYKGSNEEQPDSENFLPYTTMRATASSSKKENPIEYAFDGDEKTFWHSNEDGNQILPQSVTIDLGSPYELEQLDYLPRQDEDNKGDIKEYRIAISEDGTNFIPLVQGRFNTINKDVKKVKFKKTKGRYVRFIALNTIGETPSMVANAANISIYGVKIKEPNPATGITTDVSEIKDMEVGSTKRIITTVTPIDTTDVLVWSSNDPTVATIDHTGLVSAKHSGETTITVSANEHVKASIKVSVKAVDNENLQALIEKAQQQADICKNEAVKTHLESAIAQAKEQLNGSQEAINIAYDELLNTMQKATSVMKDLQALENYQQVNLDEFEVGQVANAYKELVNEAAERAKNPVENAKELHKTIEDLTTAYKALRPLNLAMLKEAIAYAEALDKNIYIQNDALKKFESTLKSAKNLKPTSNKEIGKMIEHLTVSINKLSKKASKKQLQELQESYNKYCKLDVNKYRTEDRKKIKDALEKAKDALNNDNISDVQVIQIIQEVNGLAALNPIEDENQNNDNDQTGNITKPEDKQTITTSENDPNNTSADVKTGDIKSVSGILSILGSSGCVAWCSRRKQKKLEK